MARKIKVKSKGENADIISKKHRWLAIILKENEGAVGRFINEKKDAFRLDGNTYFSKPSGAYLTTNRMLLSIYLEGVSTPLTHANIIKEIKKRKYNIEGREFETDVTVIKGLKYDSKIIDMLLNRGLADEFTKQHFDLPMIILFIIMIGSMIINIACLGYLIQMSG